MLEIILCDDDPFILKIIREQVEHILSESIPEAGLHVLPPAIRNCFFI